MIKCWKGQCVIQEAMYCWKGVNSPLVSTEVQRAQTHPASQQSTPGIDPRAGFLCLSTGIWSQTIVWCVGGWESWESCPEHSLQGAEQHARSPPTRDSCTSPHKSDSQKHLPFFPSRNSASSPCRTPARCTGQDNGAHCSTIYLQQQRPETAQTALNRRDAADHHRKRERGTSATHNTEWISNKRQWAKAFSKY